MRVVDLASKSWRRPDADEENIFVRQLKTLEIERENPLELVPVTLRGIHIYYNNHILESKNATGRTWTLDASRVGPGAG